MEFIPAEIAPKRVSDKQRTTSFGVSILSKPAYGCRDYELEGPL